MKATVSLLILVSPSPFLFLRKRRMSRPVLRLRRRPQRQSAGRTGWSQQNPPAIVIRTENVIVPVTVKDNRGQLVGDLQKEDFRVFVDGVEQKILGFSSNAVPLSAVVLIDNDLEQKQASGRTAAQSGGYIGGFRPRG